MKAAWKGGMARSWALFCLLLIPLLLFSGCKEAKEINDMAIVSGFSLDWDGTQGKYLVVGETVNSIPEAGSPPSEIQTVKGTGATVAEALSNCQEGESRQIYWNHAKVVVIDRNLAAHGIRPLLEYILDEYEIRLSVDLILVDEGEASQIWEWDTGASGIRSFDLEELLMTGEKDHHLIRLKAYQALEVLERGQDRLRLPVVRQGDEGQVRLKGVEAL